MSASSASLFLSIYASNPSIELLFIPLCSLVFLTPFILTALIYGPFADDFQTYVSTLTQGCLQLSATLVVAAVATRLISGWRQAVAKKEINNIRAVPIRPYWAPAFQHIIEAVFGGERFWTKIRDSCAHSAFMLILGGARHVVTFSPAHADEIEKSGVGRNEKPFGHEVILRNVFGLNSKLADIDHLLNSFNSQLRKGDWVKQVTRKLEQDLPNFVTFMPTEIDQLAWERSARVEVREQDGPVGVVEVPLFSILREFFVYNLASTLLGSTFANGYPELAKDLATLDSSFYSLASGLPRWFPVPGLVAAHSARRRLLLQLTLFTNALDTSLGGKSVVQTYGDLSDVSPTFVSLAKEANERNLSPDNRARATLALLWHITSKAVPLSSWLLYHLLYDQTKSSGDSSVIYGLTAELAPLVKVTQSPPMLGMSEPPTIKFPSDALIPKSSILQQCLIETVRLSYGAWQVRAVDKMIDIIDHASKTTTNTTGDKVVWRLKKGQWVHLAGALYHGSPTHFPDPESWQPARYEIQSQTKGGESRGKGKGSKAATLDWKGIGGPGWSEDEDVRPLVNVAVAFVVGLVSLWDLELIKESSVASRVRPAGWNVPNHDPKMRIRRKKL